MSKRFEGRVAFITGGTGGIGSAICSRLAREGAAVVVADLPAADPEGFARRLQAEGCEAFGVGLDVSSRESWEKAIKGLPERFRGWQVLVNVAGIVRDRSLPKMTDAEWDIVMGVNLRGAWLGCQAAFVSVDRSGWGRIVNITSTAIYGTYGQANYSAAKAGLMGLTHTAALEGARRGILVNAIAPGVIDTSITSSVPDAVRAEWVTRTPLGRIGHPSEIASTVAFLVSEDASFITGQTIVVDGGATTGDY